LDDPWRALLTLLRFGFDSVPFPEATGDVPVPAPAEQSEPGRIY
jgi:hypothetical protein